MLLFRVLVLVGTMKSLVNRTRARGRPYLRRTSAGLANCELFKTEMNGDLCRKQ
jgi:hypothetical protein